MNRAGKDFIGAVQRFQPDPDILYTIEDAGHISHTPRHAILVYCKHGLVAPASDPTREGFYFDSEGIRTLQRIEFLRGDCGVNLTGIKMILRLMNAVERLRETSIV